MWEPKSKRLPFRSRVNNSSFYFVFRVVVFRYDRFCATKWGCSYFAVFAIRNWNAQHLKETVENLIAFLLYVQFLWFTVNLVVFFRLSLKWMNLLIWIFENNFNICNCNFFFYFEIRFNFFFSFSFWMCELNKFWNLFIANGTVSHYIIFVVS